MNKAVLDNVQKNKRILFVSLVPPYHTTTYYIHTGIAYLASLLKEKGYSVHYVSVQENWSPLLFLEYVKSINPSIVSFSLTTSQFPYLPVYSNILAEQTSILQLAGGVGPTLEPEKTLTMASIDGVCIGEGERPFSSLLLALEKNKPLKTVKGFYWNVNGNIIKHEVLPFVEDLSSLPSPDFSLFKDDMHYSGKYNSLGIALSRGCPYSCTFCCNHSLRNLYHSSKGYVRVPSVDYVISLLKTLLHTFPKTTHFRFSDELLIAHKAWFFAFAKRYKQEIGLSYSLPVRTELLTEDIVVALKQSGCTLVNIGLESGNYALRKQLLRKDFTNDLFIKKVRLLQRYDILVSTYNMLGLPFETPQQMKETFLLNKKLNVDTGNCNFFIPYVGTSLYDFSKKHNLLRSSFIPQGTNYASTIPAIKMNKVQTKAAIYYSYKLHYFLDTRAKLHHRLKGTLLYPYRRLISGLEWPIRWTFHQLKRSLKFF